MRSTRVGGFHGGLGTEGKAPVGGGGGAFLGVSGAPLCCAGVACKLVFAKKGWWCFWLGAGGAVLGRGTVLVKWFAGGAGRERGGDVNKDQPAGRVHTGRVCSFGCG